MASNTKLFRSFGRGESGTSIVFEPCTVEEIMAAFDFAHTSKKRVTIRGGGHSFQDQALHDCDHGDEIILTTDKFKMIEPAPGANVNLVRLGAGVTWGDYFTQALGSAKATGEPLRIPGSMQTGRAATAGGTLAGDCLSRFSGLLGKESQWIESFRIVTPKNGLLDVNKENNSDLFNAVIGGLGYLGFVTDITYRLIDIDSSDCAHTQITTQNSFEELVKKQLDLISLGKQNGSRRAVSSAWFTDLIGIFIPGRINGAVFDSTYASPSEPRLPGWPLYSDIDGDCRYYFELMARVEPANFFIHEVLYAIARENNGEFENELLDFLFFMDANTNAKIRFETQHPKQQFPIVQQTWVIPAALTAKFAQTCEDKLKGKILRPAESDMLFVSQDECLMSANYKLDGFAVSLGFEPLSPDGTPPPGIVDLFQDLSVDCYKAGGRIHLVKNVHADRDTFRNMFSPQIEEFETIKKAFDPDVLLQNKFSDAFFKF